MTNPDRRENDVSNTRLSRLFSFEIMGSVLATVFIMGMGYRALAGGQEISNARDVEQTAKIHDIEKQQRSIKETVASIQTDTAVIRNEQSHMNNNLEKNTRAIEKVLEILMRHDNRNVP